MSSATSSTQSSNGPSGRNRRILIIGAGSGGLGMGIRLKQAGFENFTILEKAPQLGGTWYHNRYPGCACDIPSHLYSYSFEINRHWSRPYAPQAEILQYLEGCADKYDVRKHCRFNCAVERADWSDSNSEWQLTLASGETLTADFVVSAMGMFNHANYPDIEGLDSFAGDCFHSARWDDNFSAKGKRIAVIGSAASAVQLVPELVKEAAQVDYYQRTANWIMPKEDTPYDEQQLAYFRDDDNAAQELRDVIFDAINGAGPRSFDELGEGAKAACIENMSCVKDEALRARLMPDHPWACKRPLFSNDYYPAFNKPNLKLVTDPIIEIVPNAVVTADGKERPVDAIVLATGFKTTEYLSAIEVTGRNGLDLKQAWSDGAIAFQGVTTAGFPNLFMLYGPNTNSDSLITMIEYHAQHALLHIEHLAENNLDWIDVKKEAMLDYNDELQKDIANITVWFAGCTEYYRAPSGRIVTQWPGTMQEHHDMLMKLNFDAYEYAPESVG